jgi:hypothetical protein
LQSVKENNVVNISIVRVHSMHYPSAQHALPSAQHALPVDKCHEGRWNNG